MIALSYPPRSIPLLINARQFFFDRHHHQIIPDANPRYNHFSTHPIPSCPKVAAFALDNATNNTESTIGDDTTDATESIVFDETDKKSNDDDDSEFYLYKGPSALFALWKFPRDISNTTTTADEAKPAKNGNPHTENCTSKFNGLASPPVNPFRKQLMTWENFMCLEALAVSSLIPHDYAYDNDDCSTNSDLDYFQQEGNTSKHVDSYNFVHDTNPSAPMDIPHKYDAKYFDYLDKHYSLFEDCSSFIYMQKLTNKDIANHIKEINNDVTCVNFDANYSYQCKQMIVNKFDKIFQGIIDADLSCTFPLSRYFLMDWYTGWFRNCTDVQEQIDSIVITSDPNIDLFTLRDMIGDHLESSLTDKGLRFWQQRCELQLAHKEAAEHKIDIPKFITPHDINDEINWLHLEHLYTAKNVIISLYDLRSKILPKDALNIYPDDFHTWIDNTGAIELSIWINRLKPMIYERMKKAQLDNTHPFWSMHKQTIRIA